MYPSWPLAEMRERNENEEFRRKISCFVSELHESSVEVVDRMAAEVGCGIAPLHADHKNKVREIEEKYVRLHLQTAMSEWVTLGAMFVLVLAPFVSVIPPLAVIGKYVWNKGEQVVENRKAARSLAGILVAAHDAEE